MKKLLIFKSTTCLPCKSLTAALKDYWELVVDQVTTIDSTSDRDSFLEYNVRSVPTSIILVDGKEVRRHTGFTNKQEYLDFVNQ